MTNSADPDQLASSEANWSGSTLFAKTGYVVFSKRRVKCTTFEQGLIYQGSQINSDIVFLCKSSRNVRKRTFWHWCAQWRLKSACASAQSDLSLRCQQEEILHPCLSKTRPVKILISLCECAAGWLETTLRAHGTFSDVAGRFRTLRFIFVRCGSFKDFPFPFIFLQLLLQLTEFQELTLHQYLSPRHWLQPLVSWVA